MPQALSFSSWSSLHMSKSPRVSTTTPTKKKAPAPYQPTSVVTTSAAGPSSSSSSSASTSTPTSILPTTIPAMSRDAFVLAAGSSTPRATSMSGKKRPRESDEGAVPPHGSARRTRSVGAGSSLATSSSERDPNAREREAFQRQLIGVFVPRALKESAEGNSANYADLVAHFLPTATTPVVPLAPLLPLLRALTAHVSLLQPQLHGNLITAILALPWATGDDRFVKTFVGWAGILVSAHPGWAKEVVTMAVKGFKWQPPAPGSAGSTTTRRIFHARHHFLLAHLLELIPTLPTVLQQILFRTAPHKRDTEIAQSTWVRNCCDLIEYCPELGARVWSSLVDKMLRIDVEITNSVEDDDDDDDDDDEDDEDFVPNSSLDPFDLLISQDVPKEGADDSDSDSDDDDDEADPDIDALSSDEEPESDDEDRLDLAKLAAARKRKREALKSMRAKLDGMLSYFLRHLQEAMGACDRGGVSAAELGAQLASATSSGNSTPRNRPGTPTMSTPTGSTPPMGSLARGSGGSGALTPAQSLAHFQTLLNLFSRQILPTSATQHLPFVIFMCSSFTPAHTELFLHLLVLQALYARTGDAPKLASQPVSLQQRVAATVYIGSLVCRARFVTDDQARTVLQYLLAYVEGKLAQARGGDATSLAQLDELPLFYAVCQAVMLIFCFRWRAFGPGSGPSDDCVAGELEMDDGGASAGANGPWLSDLDTLQRALTSELNPLLGCNPTIVNTFAKVAHSTGFAYCFSIIEANQQAAARASSGALRGASGTNLNGSGNASGTASPAHPLSATGSGAGRKRAANPMVHAAPRAARQANVDAGLDSYFPFDPYDLPRSGEFVEGIYRTWDEVAVDLGGDSDSDDDSDEEEDGDESVDDDDMEELDSENEGRTKARAMPARLPKVGSYGEHRRRDLLRDGGLSTSLENMSISPNVA